MTTLTAVKTSEAAKMLVLKRVAKHHERMAYIAKLEAENIELRRALSEVRERLYKKILSIPDGSLSVKLTRRSLLAFRAKNSPGVFPTLLVFRPANTYYGSDNSR